MTIRIDALPPCVECGGTRYPFILCESCGAASVLRDVPTVGRTAACSECGTPNTWQLICDVCHARSSVPDAEGPPSTPPEPQVSAGPPGLPPRPRRRVRGDVDTRALLDLLKVLGLDAARAHALIDRGYDAVWKIARAKEETLARIPELGPAAARKMLASFHLMRYAPPRRSKDSVAKDEYACSLCGCVTSAFAPSCVECGAVFDEEEMDEEIRHAFSVEGTSGFLAFYDGRLAEKPDDWELHYARGLLLESLGRVDEAIDSLERAASRAPDAKKVRVAQLRIEARAVREPKVAAKLRSTAQDLLEDVAWEQEVAQLDRVISTAERECPSCGTVVPAEMALCPSCGVRLAKPAAQAPKRKRPASTELDAVMDDLLVGELEESLSEEELELTKAAVLDWLITELEDSMAPDAQAVRPPKKRLEEAKRPEVAEPTATPPSPLTDSLGFISRWMQGDRGLVSGARPKQTPRGGGRVNGLVNGVGRVNGLVNGVGRTNGLVNGVGRVNGLATPIGRVNGLVSPRGRVNGLVTAQGRTNGIVTGSPFVRPRLRGLVLPYPSRRVRLAATFAAIAVAVLISGLLFLPPAGPTAPIVIDGSFQDWASISKFDVATVAQDRNVSLARFASLLDRNTLYLFASTRGGVFADSSDYDGIYFLIDGDGNASTGYSFDGLGAEAVVETVGANYHVEGARMYSFPAGSEANWSQRQGSGSVRAASSSEGIEVAASVDDILGFNPTQFRVAVYADNFRGVSSRSLAPLTPQGAAVVLDVRPLASVVGLSPTTLFEIQVHGQGLPAAVDVAVAAFSVSSTPGAIVSFSPDSVTLTQGQPNATVTASVAAPGFLPGDLVQVNVTGAIASYPVVVHDGLVRAYVMSVLSTVRVDGLFSEWGGKDAVDSDPSRVNDSNVDIVRYGAVIDASSAYFHVSVAGDLLDGRVPERFVRSPPGQGGSGTGQPIPLPRQTGEDILRVYIDLNASDSRGGQIAGIRADYLFEVRGDGGRIRSRALYAWNGDWVPTALPAVALAKNDTDIEGSLALAPTANTRMVFASTDWAGIGDITPPVNASIQAPAPAPQRTEQSINAPEFHDLLVPIGATVALVLVLGRRRRSS